MMINPAIDKARLAAEQARISAARPQVKKTMDTAEIDRVAEDFEAVFLSQMLENMFADVDVDPMSDGTGEEVYKSMMLEEYGKIVARSGGIGVADHVKREMLRIQEGR